MKVLWVCGLPEAVRCKAVDRILTDVVGAAWSWVLGHLPPPSDVELHVICPVLGLHMPQISFEYMGVQWHCFRQKRFEIVFLWMRFWFKIRSFVKSLNPDVVHGWGGETGCGWLATWLSTRAIVSVQGLLKWFWHLSDVRDKKAKKSLRTRLSWFCEWGTYKRARVLLVESDASRHGLKTYYGQDGIYVPHPLREEFLKCDLCNRFSLTHKHPIRFVYVGNIDQRKGAMDAVRAFFDLGSQETQLIMIGDGGDRHMIESFVSRKQLEDRVKLCGIVSVHEIVQEFANAQFFLLPSYADTGPTALKEALACGLYPICYDNSGPQSLISHYGCGTLVETANIRQLSAAMDKCIADVDECIKAASTAAMKVRQELSRENVWSMLRQVYTTEIGA